MYNFADTIIKKQFYEKNLPIPAMNYDGIFLEEVFENYQTLNVSGREMLSVELQSDNISTGSIVSSQRLPARSLKVSYQIRNDDPEQLLINYRQLMKYLYREQDVPIYFNDERDIFYYGRYSGSDEVPSDRYMLTSSFDIYCANPRKYSQKVFEVKDQILSPFVYKAYPSKIIIKTYTDGNLEVNNNKQKIKITNGKLRANDTVIIDFDEGKLIINGINHTNWLDLASDFENFELKQNQKITCTN
ncbi:phage tail family protein, partial [Melissococcus plutonius]|nr:phage tail family protein [Melissococcus plutonius]